MSHKAITYRAMSFAALLSACAGPQAHAPANDARSQHSQTSEASGQSSETNGQTSEASGQTSEANGQTSEAQHATTSEGAAPQANSSPRTAAGSKQNACFSHTWQDGHLQSDRAFLDQPLPTPAPARYAAWTNLSTIHVGQSHLKDVHYLGNEELLLTRGYDEKVRVYDARSRQSVHIFDSSSEGLRAGALLPLRAPADVPSGSIPPAFLWERAGQVELVEGRGGAVLWRLDTGDVDALRWSPDRRYLLTRSSSGDGSQLRFYRHAASGAPTQVGEFDVQGRIHAWDLSRDNQLLAYVAYPHETVHVVDLKTGCKLVSVPTQDFVADVALSPDGRALAVAGQGLLLIDLVRPERRAYYSYFHNNLGAVRFSPSGDAIATSSYDGRVRLFSWEIEEPRLELLRSLHHLGRANVYNIEFSADGNRLVSSSGDQTVRQFGARYAPAAKSAVSAGDEPRFRSLDDWKASFLSKSRPTDAPGLNTAERFPSRLDGPAAKTRLRPGRYACKVATEYRLRDCTVRKRDDGHTILEFHQGNLLELRGVVYDDGPVIRYEAWLSGRSSIVDCPGCNRQPLHGVLRGAGNSYRGLLLFKNYFDPLSPPPLPAAQERIEDADDRFSLVLQYRGPLPASAPPTDAPAARAEPAPR